MASRRPLVVDSGVLKEIAASDALFVELIKFKLPLLASSDPNTLDGYEEGTWTPSISANNAEATPTYVSGGRNGYYIRIGGLLIYWFGVAWTAIGSPTGLARVLGLPFDPSVYGLWSGPLRASGFSNYTNKTIMGSYYPGPQLVLNTMEGADVNGPTLPSSGSLVGGGMTRI